MSSSDEHRFVADLFEAPATAAPDATESAWALDDFYSDDLFGAAHAADGPPFGAAAPAPAIDAELMAQLEASAYARGRADGEQAGFTQGETNARALLEAPVTALRAVAAQLSAAEQRWLSTLEENIAALAVAVAQHIIAREISIDPTTVVPIVQQAIASFPLDQPLTVRVHPDDASAVQGAMTGDTVVREIRVVADATVVRGGSLVEGRERIVDGRVDTALERVFRAISQVAPS
jgi:flagellar assembly protein FliH